jgi:hypothetical protein
MRQQAYDWLKDRKVHILGGKVYVTHPDETTTIGPKQEEGNIGVAAA